MDWKELAKNLGAYGAMLESTGLVHQEGEELTYRDPEEEKMRRAAGTILTGFSRAIEKTLDNQKDLK